mgnify:CR=1 FL=1
MDAGESGAVIVRAAGGGLERRIPLPVEEMHRGRALEARHRTGPWMARWWWHPERGWPVSFGAIVRRCLIEGWDLYSLPAEPGDPGTEGGED